MNRYGNVAGFYNPERTEKLLNELNSLVDIVFVDCSWHNDTCDSVLEEGCGLEVYFPNSDEDRPEDEEYNTFCCTTEERDDYYECQSLEEVAEWVKKETNKIKHK